MFCVRNRFGDRATPVVILSMSGEIGRRVHRLGLGAHIDRNLLIGAWSQHVWGSTLIQRFLVTLDLSSSRVDSPSAILRCFTFILSKFAARR